MHHFCSSTRECARASIFSTQIGVICRSEHSIIAKKIYFIPRKDYIQIKPVFISDHPASCWIRCGANPCPNLTTCLSDSDPWTVHGCCMNRSLCTRENPVVRAGPGPSRPGLGLSKQRTSTAGTPNFGCGHRKVRRHLIGCSRHDYFDKVGGNCKSM